MRNLHEIDRHRRTDKRVLQRYGSTGDHTSGVFSVPSTIDGAELTVIASSDGQWEHVSVSRRNRCPNWTEMEAIKRLFFADGETCMQLHVPPSDHISCHPYCLHIWRPVLVEIPRPPSEYVA